MARLQLLGPRDLLCSAVAFLQEQGVLELRAPGAKPDGSPPFIRPCAPDLDEEKEEARLLEVIRRAEALAARLASPLRVSPAPMSESSSELLAELSGLEEKIAALEVQRASLREEREATERFSSLVVALAPIRHSLDPALQSELHAVVLKKDRVAEALLTAEVRRIAGGVCEISSRSLDPERSGFLIAVPHAHSRALTALLFERGLDEVKLPASYAGKPLLEALFLLAARVRSLPSEELETEAELARIGATWAPVLAGASAWAQGALERLRARRRCGETRFTFVVSGYMPEEGVAALRRAAAARFGDRMTMIAHPPERALYGEVPVVLRNRPLVRPFEMLLALVPLPRYGSVDPTPWLALFFPLFFGLVLGDVALGAVGTLLALVGRARRWGGAAGRHLSWIALCCSVSAIAFGLLFGEALGELGAHVGFRPVLLDRRRAFLAFLRIALVVGVVHVTVGMALGVINAIRARRQREAIGRAARLLLLGTAACAAASLSGILSGAALRPTLVVGTALLAVAVLADGPLALIELALGLGNVLSYARLMALGLASLMLAEAANLVAGRLRPVVVGIALSVVLHAVNFTLGLISPTVAALRLHYVEFFEKFYDEGGVPYRPFALPA